VRISLLGKKGRCLLRSHPDEETFIDALTWKNVLVRTCTALLWEVDRGGKRVADLGES
jgi:hypothetical protein